MGYVLWMCCVYGQRTWLSQLITPISAAVNLRADYNVFLQYYTISFEFIDQCSIVVFVVFTL